MEFDWGAYPALLPVSQGYSREKGTFPRVTHPSAADPEGSARLACVKPAASVRSEPGSNSQVERSLPSAKSSPKVETPRPNPQTDPFLTSEPLHIVQLIRAGTNVIVCRASVPAGTGHPTNGEADTHIIGNKP